MRTNKSCVNLVRLQKNATRLLKKDKLSDQLAVKVIFVGAMHTRYEYLINRSFGCARSAFSTQLTAGFISSKTRFNIAEAHKTAVEQRARNFILQKRDRWPNVYVTLRAVYRIAQAIRKAF